MKKKSLSTLIILSSLVINNISGCSTKSAPLAPIPTSSANQQQDNLQNFVPTQQGTNANPAYYGNNSALSDNNGEFPTSGSHPKSNDATVTTSSTNSIPTTASSTDNTDLGIGNLPNLQPYSPPGGASGGSGYSLAGNFPIDQDKYSIPFVGGFLPSRNNWQAVGIAVSGSNIIVSAYDSTSLVKKGTVVSMSAEDGSAWSNVGSKWLGIRHPMSANVKGVTVDGSGKIFANDSTNFIYVVDKVNSIVPTAAGLSGALDITYVNGSLIVATSSGLKKFDPTAPTTGSDFGTGVSPTGGIGADKAGNLFVVSNSTIKKVDSKGTVTDFTTGVDGAIDVVPTDENKVCVLMKDSIKIFDPAGKLLTSIGRGDLVAPKSIAASGKSLFVADSGTTYKDSNIIKYSILAL